LQIAQHGMVLESPNGKKELSIWLRDHASSADGGREVLSHQTGVATWAAQQAVLHNVSLKNYLYLQERSGEEWSEIKPALLEQIATAKVSLGGNQGKIDIYLHEGMYKEAIALVESDQLRTGLSQVIEAVKATYPHWAFDQCRTAAANIMDNNRSQGYAEAAEWVRRGRDILLEAGLAKQWQVYITSLIQKHQRKYKLLPLLERVRDTALTSS
ncbi:MAG: hypothetical protein AAF639_41970, partial [Chloroflexota bacterium]